MLRHLHVRHLAVIEEASVDFGDGLNVVTGETGAGKSLVVDSLALLAGARASSDLIRTGAETLSVTGVFEPAGDGWRQVLGDAGIDADEAEVVVRREVSRSGRNRVFVDDHPVTVRLLSRLAPDLLRIHGQREELGLVVPDLQRAWLDQLGLQIDGAEARRLLDAVAESWEAFREVAERLERMTSDDRARHERIDLLRFQASEIAAAGLKAGEEEELRSRRQILRHAEAIGNALALGSQVLLEQEDSVGASLARVGHALERIVEHDPRAQEWLTELEELRIRAEDLGATLRSRQDDIESDPARLNGIEDRLAEIERLLRKYGADTAEVLEHERRVREELMELEGNDERISELERELSGHLATYGRSSLELTERRRRWAEELERRMAKELAELALPSASLAVRLRARSQEGSPVLRDGEPVESHAWGVEGVVFVFSSNPGEEPRPLARVASGGELSRIYLALQLACGVQGTSRSTLVFDEIDTGVGGAEAASIGAKMKTLAQGGQVLAVTHLPQVACAGDRHHRVYKKVSDGRTRVAVGSLEEAERVEELARMLGGAEITDTTRRHARELLGLAEDERRGLHSVS